MSTLIFTISGQDFLDYAQLSFYISLMSTLIFTISGQDFLDNAQLSFYISLTLDKVLIHLHRVFLELMSHRRYSFLPSSLSFRYFLELM